MTAVTSSWRRVAAGLLASVPVVSLFLNGISWLRYGIDLPFLDDFRVFERGTALSLSLKDLFTPSNDTLYPVGMALDALAQRYLNGNAVAYQFLSMMTVIGGLLWLQWRLLRWAIADWTVAAAAFGLCVFMVRPESYWGLQNLAYHQGLPVLFLMLGLAVIVDAKWRAWWGVPAVFGLGLLAGLSYISGAFSSFGTALALLGLAAWMRRGGAIVSGGFALLAASLVSMAIQGRMILTVQHGQLYDYRKPWALPTEVEFWAYLLGKIARALMLPPEHVFLSLGIVLAVTALVATLTVVMVKRARAQADAEDTRVAMLFVPILVTVLVYLAIIAAARTTMRAVEVTGALDVFAFSARSSFYFFWVAWVFPWLAAAGYVAMRGSALRRWRPETAMPLLSLALVAAAIEAGAMAHPAFYRTLQARRMNEQVSCLQQDLAARGEIRCQWLTTGDFTPVLGYARAIGSSFVRYFPLPATPLGTDSPAPLYRLSATQDLELVNLATPERGAEGSVFTPANDPILVLHLPATPARQCSTLEVTMAIRTEQDDFAELFLIPDGGRDFAAPAAASAPVKGGDFTTVTMFASRLAGFSDRIRIDPVVKAQAFTLRELEVRCRSMRAQ